MRKVSRQIISLELMVLMLLQAKNTHLIKLYSFYGRLDILLESSLENKLINGCVQSPDALGKTFAKML